MPTWTSEQLEAIEKTGSNIIVSAGAGSGKTAVLSERVIYKLKHGVHIDELLILTFTRAAAEEMKERIRKKIKKDPSLSSELDILESAYITTFDSFALSVLKKYHYLLNLPKDIQVTDEALVELEKINIMDEVFEHFYESHDQDFESMIERFSLKNDTTIKNTILNLADKIGSFIKRDEFLKFIDEEYFSPKVIDSFIEEYRHLIRERQENLSLTLNNAHYYFDESYNDKIDALVLPLINAESIEELSKYASVRLPNLKSGASEEEKNAKEELKSAIHDLQDIVSYGNEEDIYNSIVENEGLIHIIVRILKEYFKNLDELKSSKNLYTFSDIANLSMRVLRENEFAREELKHKFKEIMIDEYQDTNDVQEEFISYIANDNVYMVGDIKQSIYRFRGSNPKIFHDKYESYSKNESGYKIDLIKNFRSRGEVIDGINHIFDLLMDNKLGGAEYTVSHEMVFGNKDYLEKREDYNYEAEVLEYVPLDSKEYSNDEIEAFAIARDIISKKNSNYQVFDKETNEMRPFKYSDAVIILDRSKFFEKYKQIFEYLNIPLVILKDGMINTSVEVYLIKNILDMIIRLHNNDYGVEFQYDFMSIGRSFLYEYSDQELFNYMSEKNFSGCPMVQDFKAIENYSSMTIKDFLEYILDKTEFYSKIYKIGDAANIDIRINKLLDLAESFSKMGNTLEDFRDYLFKIIDLGLEIKYTEGSDDAEAVRIMTIHKSKGLEYPVCYFADLVHDFNTSDIKEKFICDARYGLITPPVKDEDKDSVLKTLYKEKYREAEISEKIRLFYVALTRAREKMILVLPKKDTRKLEKNMNGTIELPYRLKFKSLGDFIYGIKEHSLKYFRDIKLEDLGLSKDYLYIKNKTNEKNIESCSDFTVTNLNIETEVLEEKHFSKELPKLLTKETQEKLAFGTRIHELLENLDFKDPSKINIENEFIKSKIDKFLESDLLKNVKDAKIYKEYEFIYEKDDTMYHGIIDAMFEYDDHIDIVDYKLKNTTDEAYIEQLHGYRDYISTKTSKPVNTYLYSILDSAYTKIE